MNGLDVRAALLRALVADGIGQITQEDIMSNTAFTRIRTCALAVAAVFFIGSQASAQPQGGPNVTVVNTPLPVTVTNQTPLSVTVTNQSMPGTQ